MPPYTRREVLASLGIGGVGVATIATLGSDSPYTSYTYAQSTGDERVQVAWYETYNGTLLEHQGGTGSATANDTLDSATSPTYVPEVSGPVVSLGNVMPGDSGSLGVGVRLAERPEGSNPISLELTGTLTAADENGRTEPERKAGGTTDSTGQLPEALEAVTWLDDGPVPCDGVRLLDTTIAAGSFADVLDALSDGVRVCTACFGVRSHYCLGFRWSLPVSTGNVAQSDGVEFELAIEAHDRGVES
jgi:hypothetical protein